jgi:hypothetical protein
MHGCAAANDAVFMNAVPAKEIKKLGANWVID